ncbi:EF-hand domain-containing protein [Tropicimonas sp. IMCC6043]|uniref:EF-hand domain-containing protein n=1 Tax=Tropicimonas sp. IMCC6043 TaxID=2510645 RepID=UPI0013EAF4E8|nr:calcium-binding protein [Tropicimonas sp. IMCC6043]
MTRLSRIARPALVLLLLGGTAASAQQFVQGAYALDRWDINRDGRVTLTELRSGRDTAFAGYDSNGDGVLSNLELGAVTPRGAARNTNQGVLRYGLDANGDGVVSKTEYVAGSAAWLQRMDSDGDGVLTSADFGRNARGRGQGQGRGNGLRWNNG